MVMKRDNYDGVVRSEVDHVKDVIPIRLNEDERKQLEEAKVFLEQPKDGTCLKQLAQIGYIVIHGSQTGKVLELIFENKRRNKRTGIIDYEA